MERAGDRQKVIDALELLDSGQRAASRVLAISGLLMACRDDDTPEPEDLRVIAQLIHSETEIMRDCLYHFRQAVKDSPPPEP